MNFLPRITGLLVLIAASLNAHGATLNNDNIDVRTTRYDMQFANLSFAGAFDQRSDRAQFHGAVGDTGPFDINGFAPGTTISVVTGAGMKVSNLQPANASGDVLYTATVTGSTDLTLTQSWANSRQLSSGVTAGGLYYLDFSGKNVGLLRNGGVFDFFVSIPGNWSSFGTSSGQVQFLGINPEFSVVQNFVYDAGSNRTIFEAVDTNYSQVSSDVHFVLYGAAAPVPEPGTFALLAFGTALLLLVRQRFLRHRG